MKKTLTVNLGGTVYHIDEDAFYLLDNYLVNLRTCFRRQQGAEEIVEDIEARIAELFTGYLQGGKQVITIRNVEEVISRIGKPEEMSGQEAQEESYKATPNEEIKVKINRRLYRNPDDKMLGGVLSGISAYFGWEPVWPRIIYMLLVLFGVGTPVLAYFICWIAIPLARTAEQKLAMRGEQVTIENIGKTVKDGFEYAKNGTQDFVRSERAQQAYHRTTSTASDVFGWILKAFLILAAIVFSPILFVLLFAFIIVLIVMIAAVGGSGAALYHMVPGVDWGILTASPGGTIAVCIAFILLIGIPLGSLLYVILQNIFNWGPMPALTRWILLVLWIAGIIASYIFFLRAGGWFNLFGIDFIREVSWTTL